MLRSKCKSACERERDSYFSVKCESDALIRTESFSAKSSSVFFACVGFAAINFVCVCMCVCVRERVREFVYECVCV